MNGKKMFPWTPADCFQQSFIEPLNSRFFAADFDDIAIQSQLLLLPSGCQISNQDLYI